jgi:hypothetical protein
MSIDRQNPSGEDAIHRCKERAKLSAHLAGAFFDLGRSALLLGNRSESLAAYAKACELSETEAPIEAAARSLARLDEFAETSDQEVRLANRLLLVARAAKLLSMKDQALKGEAEQKAAAALHQLRELALKPDEPIAVPVVVVAGGCDPSVAPQMNEYHLLLSQAFAGFSGSIISGGTTAGISGIVAGLTGNTRKIALLPRRDSLSADAVPDSRFQIRWMESEEGFSVSLAVQYWIEMLVSGIRPAVVRLLGIDGGEISAFEYRLALALGARVGVLPESGREAAKLATDSDWKTSDRLVLLPANEDSVRAFIGKGAQTG